MSTCLTCHDYTCPRHGKDAPPCEDYTTVFNGDDAAPATPQPFWVYIAGPLSDMPVGYLGHCSAFHTTAVRLMHHRFVPINPATDSIEVVSSYTMMEPLSVQQVKGRSLDLIRLMAFAPPDRTAVLVLAERRVDGQLSSGTADEIALAEDLGINVVHSMSELLALRGTEP